MQPQAEEQSPYQLPKKARHWAWLGPLITSLVLASSLLLIFMLRQAIVDRYNVMSYAPSSAISTIIKDSGMVNTGLFYFEASLPEVDDYTTFNSHCQRTEADSAILGCYTGQRIYIYDVKNDSRLSGIKTVTAAHEMLHAAWERLPQSEKDRLKPLLLAAYDRVKNDDLVSRMAYYTREEPGKEVEELHSILGTEFANLGSELETYYSMYFSNRSELVTMSEAYSKTFADLKSQQAALKLQIDNLKADITSRVEKYNAAVVTLNADIAQLEADRSSVDTTDYNAVAAFNNRRSELLAQSSYLENERTAIINEENTYNSLVIQYNQSVLVGQSLLDSLDSTLTNQTTVSK